MEGCAEHRLEAIAQCDITCPHPLILTLVVCPVSRLGRDAKSREATFCNPQTVWAFGSQQFQLR